MSQCQTWWPDKSSWAHVGYHCFSGPLSHFLYRNHQDPTEQHIYTNGMWWPCKIWFFRTTIFYQLAHWSFFSQVSTTGLKIDASSFVFLNPTREICICVWSSPLIGCHWAWPRPSCRGEQLCLISIPPQSAYAAHRLASRHACFENETEKIASASPHDPRQSNNALC